MKHRTATGSRVAAITGALLLLGTPLAAAPAPALPLESRNDTSEVRLPPYQRVVLPNGLVVCVMPRPALPLVEMRLMLRGGSASDPAAHAGVANVVARLLARHPASGRAPDSLVHLAEIGGQLFADVGAEDLTISTSVLAHGTSVALRAVRDAAVSPRLAPAEFAAALRDIRGDIAAARDDPAAVADQALSAALFARRGIGHSSTGTETSLARLRLADVRRWHAAHARPDSAALVIVGAVDTARVWQEVRELFTGWRVPVVDPTARVAAAPFRAGDRVPRARPRAVVVSREDLTQAQVRFAEIACGRDNPDYAALQVANALLAGGYSSRLVREIRVAHGLTYGIDSRFATYRHTGYFAVSTSTQNRHLREVLTRTLAATTQLLQEGPSEAEVASAKAYILGQYPLGLQAPEDLAEQLVDQEFYPLPADEVPSYVARVRAVNTADVARVLRRWVHPARWQIVVVAPEAVARRALRGIAPLRVIAPE